MAADTAEFFIEQLRRVIAALGWTVTATNINGDQVTVTVQKRLT